MVLGTNRKRVTACFKISTFEVKLLKKCIENKLFRYSQFEWRWNQVLE